MVAKPKYAIDAGICPQWRSNWLVQSMTGVDNCSYLVQFFGLDGKSCDCPAYRYSGVHGQQHCKHIDFVREHGCFFLAGDSEKNDWEGRGTEIMLLNTSGKEYGQNCPGCKAPMIKVMVGI